MTTSARRLLHCAATLALLVLGFGLPRALVMCNHADGGTALEWEHAPGTCCHDRAQPRPGTPATGEPAVEPGGCEHDRLALELGEPPARDHLLVADAPTHDAATTFAPPAPPANATDRPPPATGPPRRDDRVALRATILLLS